MKANRSSQPTCQRVGIRSIALFAFILGLAKRGFRKIFGRQPSCLRSPYLTMAVLDQRRAWREYCKSQSSHIPNESVPKVDEELMWLATSPDRYCPSKEEAARISADLLAEHCMKLKSQHSTFPSVRARLTGLLKRLLKESQAL